MSGDGGARSVAEGGALVSQANGMTTVLNSFGGHLGDQRHRELFPLPLCAEVPRQPGLSCSARRRRARVRETVEATNSVISVLNEMYAPSHDGDFCSSSCTAAQQAAQHEVFKATARCQLPAKILTEREAVKELLQQSLSYDGTEATTTTVRPYERGLVSMPSGGHSAVKLDSVLDDSGRDIVEDPARCMLLSAEEWGQVAEEQAGFTPYMDSKLKGDPLLYCSFVKDLIDSGMVEFTSAPQDLVTPFFVVKKTGRLRLILDCRGVNRRFRPPPPMALGSGSSWSQLSIEKGDCLFTAQSDIKDYFYSLQLPSSLRPLFSLPAIPTACLTRWSVGRDLWDGLDREGWVFPMLRVVPMGWNWAMYLAQRVHQHQAMIGAGLTFDRVLVDNKPAPDLSTGEPVILPYADNLNVAGIDRDKVQAAKDGAVARLRSLGFLVHEEIDASDVVQSLGFLVDGRRGTVTPIPDRLSRVIQCCQWLARRPRVTTKAVQKILGHCVHFMMLNRGLLSIMRSLYDFVQRSGPGRHRLWTNAAREAGWLAQLLRICSADLTKPWSERVTASDASLSGIAVCSRSSNKLEVREVGKTHEGWRFKGTAPERRPRSVLVEPGDPFEDIATVKPVSIPEPDPFELNADFSEVPKAFMDPAEWHLSFAQHMQFPEHITLLEGRGIVAALRHKARTLEAFGKRQLHLNDNLGMVLAVDKGRSASMGLLRVCRRLLCLQVALGATLVCRWIPSEWNVADSGSRRWEDLRKSDAVGCVNSRSRCGGASASPSTFCRSQGDAAVAGLSGSPETKLRARFPSSDSGNFGTGFEGCKSSEEAEISASDSFSSAVSGTDSLGTGSNFNGSIQRLQAEGPNISEFREGFQAEHPRCDQVRQCLLHLSQSHVRRRLRHWRRHKKLGSCPGCLPRLFPQGNAAKIAEGVARMEQAGSGKNAASSPMATNCSTHHQSIAKRSSPSSARYHADVCSISSARGGSGTTPRRSRKPNSSASSFYFESPSRRKTRKLKDWASQRDSNAGQHNDPLSRKHVEKPLQREDKRQPLAAGLQRPAKSVAGGTSSPGAAKQLRSPLPTAALRSVARPVEPLANSQGNQNAGALGERQVCEAVRSSRTCQSGVPEAARNSSGTCPESKSRVSQGGPKTFLSQRGRTDKWIVELFSGTAHFSQACARSGINAIAYDIAYGSDCDVLNEQVLASINRFIESHQVILVWMGMPCHSWSRARRSDGGPPPLRDDAANLMGYPHLSPSDRHKVQMGNKLLLQTFLFALQFLRANIPWVIENPWSSRCWLTEAFQELQAKGARLKQVDFCQYHVPWRKSTGLLCFRCDAFASVLKCCHTKHGRCSASGHRHLILAGKDSQGCWWTRRAQPYPVAFCNSVAEVLASTHKDVG